MAHIETTTEIAVDDAIPGMKLAEAVRDAAGAFLMSPGGVLSEKIIASLKNHGIDRIAIVAPIHDETRSRLLEDALARLDQLFRNNGDAPANRCLRDFLRQYRAKELQ